MATLTYDVVTAQSPSGYAKRMDDALGSDTLGLLEEALQLAREAGHHVREEPLGDLPGGPCVVGGRKTILLNMQSPAADRLTVLLRALAGDPAVAEQPVSRLLSKRLQSTARDPAS